MKIGLPQGLLYYKYHPFFQTFFEELGAELIVSEKTSKNIVNAGLKCCTSETCLPIKIFHGHVASLINKCDLMVVPRIMKVESSEYLCPHLCSLPEMVFHSVDGMPKITADPIYFNSEKRLYSWSRGIGHIIKKNKSAVERAFYFALAEQSNHRQYYDQTNFPYKILLLGHSYTIYDPYMNMDLVSKLNAFNIGVISSEVINEGILEEQIKDFSKKPFWYDFKQAYGSATYLTNQHLINGIIYLSSFGCGMDAIITEVIKEDILNIPILVLKLDEHTGDAGVDTRLEAFTDMLIRRTS